MRPRWLLVPRARRNCTASCVLQACPRRTASFLGASRHTSPPAHLLLTLFAEEYVDVANIPSDLGGESEKLGQSPEEVSMAEHVHRINEAAGVQSVMD